jgi:hypothetical protein
LANWSLKPKPKLNVIVIVYKGPYFRDDIVICYMLYQILVFFLFWVKKRHVSREMTTTELGPFSNLISQCSWQKSGRHTSIKRLRDLVSATKACHVVICSSRCVYNSDHPGMKFARYELMRSLSIPMNSLQTCLPDIYKTPKYIFPAILRFYLH